VKPNRTSHNKKQRGPFFILYKLHILEADLKFRTYFPKGVRTWD
jgi:hypothetical protein